MKNYGPLVWKEITDSEPELTYEDKALMSIYNKIIDPTNFSIDWQAYILWYQLSGLNDFKRDSDILVYIRSTVNEFNNRS